MSIRTEAAMLWKEILQSDRGALFGTEAHRLQDRHPGDRLPQPGYMGRKYKPGSLVFVSMNPGGGSQAGMNEEDRRQYDALERLRVCDEAAAIPAFDSLTEVLEDIMPSWKIFQNFVSPVLRSARLNFPEIAYVNLLKWRTTTSSGLGKLYKLSWDAHTHKQFECLAPGRVIAIGSDAGHAFKKLHKGAVDFDFIPRVIGNNVGVEGRAALERIKASFSNRI